eukprot:UN27834
MNNPTLENIKTSSSKLLALEKLCINLKKNGHKVVIFCRMRKMMALIHHILDSLNLGYLNINGEVDGKDRQAMIDAFNNDRYHKYFAFCSTTGVGGVGITLTGANRVIIYDPDWNPANDSQAVDRAYRVGQKRNVVVYRFITCCTVEDFIYRRQISKKGLLEMMCRDGNVKKFFSRNELTELFSPLADCSVSETQQTMIKA